MLNENWGAHFIGEKQVQDVDLEIKTLISKHGFIQEQQRTAIWGHASVAMGQAKSSTREECFMEGREDGGRVVWKESPLEETGFTAMTVSRWLSGWGSRSLVGSTSGKSSLTVTDSDEVYDRDRRSL